MAFTVGKPQASLGILDDLGLSKREAALRRKQREQVLYAGEDALKPAPLSFTAGAMPSPFTSVAGTPFQAPTKTVGGSGVPTVGGVTQAYTGGGSFGFNPYGSLDRIGNAGGQMAPPSPMATPPPVGAFGNYPNMGSLGSYDAWRKSGGSPGGVSRNTGGQSFEELFGKLLGKAKGGDVDKVQPYIVNEKGTEAFQPDGGKPVPIPGGKQVFIPEQDGKIIPHDKAMKLFLPIGGQPVPIPRIPESNPELLPAKHMYRGGSVRGHPGYGYGGPLRSYGSDRGGIDELVALVQQLLAERGGNNQFSLANSIADRDIPPAGQNRTQTAPAASREAMVADAMAQSAGPALQSLEGNPAAMAEWAASTGQRLAPAAQPPAPTGLRPSTQAMLDDPYLPYIENLDPEVAADVLARYHGMGARGAALRKRGMEEGRMNAAETLASYDDFVNGSRNRVTAAPGAAGTTGITSSGQYGSGSSVLTPKVPVAAPAAAPVASPMAASQAPSIAQDRPLTAKANATADSALALLEKIKSDRKGFSDRVDSDGSNIDSAIARGEHIGNDIDWQMDRSNQVANRAGSQIAKARGAVSDADEFMADFSAWNSRVSPYVDRFDEEARRDAALPMPGLLGFEEFRRIDPRYIQASRQLYDALGFEPYSRKEGEWSKGYVPSRMKSKYATR